MIVFIRRAQEEDNTASECIRTVAATCDCKILQPYKYDGNMYGTIRTANDTLKIPVHVAKKTVDCRAEAFLRQSKQYMF